jgi:TATA-box binding protein (TBP) (component of TFIID and TFIIIB)
MKFNTIEEAIEDIKNGKMVITGAKSEKQSEDAAKIYAKAIKGVGNNVKLTDFKV